MQRCVLVRAVLVRERGDTVILLIVSVYHSIAAEGMYATRAQAFSWQDDCWGGEESGSTIATRRSGM